MSTKDKLITYSFKSKKGVRNSENIKRKTEPVASTSCEKLNVEKDLQILKDFDLNWEFGPCIGITRIERWNRAEKHGLNPSTKVKELVSAHRNDERYTQCVWNDYKDVI